jgi:hypothetical protein
MIIEQLMFLDIPGCDPRLMENVNAKSTHYLLLMGRRPSKEDNVPQITIFYFFFGAVELANVILFRSKRGSKVSLFDEPALPKCKQIRLGGVAPDCLTVAPVVIMVLVDDVMRCIDQLVPTGTSVTMMQEPWVLVRTGTGRQKWG